MMVNTTPAPAQPGCKKEKRSVHTPILSAVITLVLWTFVMWIWLYATRIPEIVKGGIVCDPQRPSSEFLGKIPARVRWKADNYNHLHEQPTIFYATAIVL